jgi:putative endonuclease
MAKMQRSGRFFVYILQCRDGTFYTGYTPDLSRRLELHNSGQGAKYTRSRRPVTLVWCKEYRYFKRAFLAELRIKKLTRKQKERLIGMKTRIQY